MSELVHWAVVVLYVAGSGCFIMGIVNQPNDLRLADGWYLLAARLGLVACGLLLVREVLQWLEL